ncbi:MAG: hypothetical protein JO247_09375 [Chloroflexi bacterium]|nr:hypothetical protein [Chloroflexota bacterium]
MPFIALPSIATLLRAGVAVVLGAITWMLVTWAQNPFREDWVAGTVPIEASHLQPGLVEVGNLGDVRIRIRAGQDAWSHVQTSDFKASVDLSKQSAGIHSLDLKIDTSGDYQVVDWQPRRVSVRLEPVAQLDVPVQLQVTGQLPEGYVLSGQSVSPDHVTVSGEQDLVQTVARAAVSVDLGGVRGDLTTSVPPQILNDAGTAVPNLQVSVPAIRVALQVDRQIAVKTVPVRVTTSGQVAAGYWLSGLTVTPESISITGGPTALAAVDYLDLPPLDLDNAKADVSRTTTLSAGNGYSIVGPADVTVKATIAPLRTTEVLPLGIAVQGVGAGMEPHMSTPTVEVTLGGLVPALSALKPGDVSAVVDVSGLGPGPHTLPIRLSAPSSVTLDAARPTTVTVTLDQPATPTASPEVGSASPSPSASAAATSLAASASASSVPSVSAVAAPTAKPAG